MPFMVIAVSNGGALSGQLKFDSDGHESVDDALVRAKNFTDEPVPGADSSFNAAYVIEYVAWARVGAGGLAESSDQELPDFEDPDEEETE